MCMSPDSILSLQRSLGRNFDAKVLRWKKSLEEQPAKTLALLREIVEKQLSTYKDSPVVNTVIDVSEESIKNYKNYKPQVFAKVCAQLESKRKEMLKTSITAEVTKETVRECSSPLTQPCGGTQLQKHEEVIKISPKIMQVNIV